MSAVWHWPPELWLQKHPTTGAWWIMGDGVGGTATASGPYERKAEAEDDKRGLARHYADNEAWYEENAI